ncbi:MAG TPA: ABC transporter permease [Actinomycetota bacterium]|nr:ABC transporter permease [Actinomycetota bacterium]
MARGEGGRLNPRAGDGEPGDEPDGSSPGDLPAPRTGWATVGLLSPPLLWLAVFFLIPLLVVAAYSVGALSLFPTGEGVTFYDWGRFLRGDSVYLQLFWKSIRMALTVSAIVVVLAYPLGYFLALVAGKRKYILLLLVIVPFLTSYLLRVLAWRVILGSEGVINTLLYSVGIRDPNDPVPWLIYSQFTVILVLVYVWVPFVALPIFVTLENLDTSMLEAGTDLGANRWGVFWRVTFPQSLPGIAAAFVFVFIPTIGEFVTPSLVGGTKGTMFGNAISSLFLNGLDWQTGSVLALFLVVVVGVLMAISARFLRLRELETI